MKLYRLLFCILRRVLILSSFAIFLPNLVSAKDAMQIETEGADAELAKLFINAESSTSKAKASTTAAKTDTGGAAGTATEISLAEMTSTAKSCETSRKAAYAACASWISPEIAGFMSQYGEMMQMGFMVGGAMGEQCGGIAKMLNNASTVMGLYTAACKSAQSICKSSCTKAVESGKQFQGVLQKDQGAAEKVISITQGAKGAEAARELGKLPAVAEKVNKYTAKSLAFCAKFELSTTSAMMGAMQALQGMAKAKQCEEMNKNQVDMSVNCQKPGAPGYDSPTCKCARNELTVAECQNININPSSATGARVVAGGGGGTNPDGTPIGPEGMDPALTAGGPGAGGPAGGAPGAPTGGGGGMGGAGGGGAGGAQDGLAATKKTNTNIFGGGFGGSGGGGGFGAGPGYGEMDEKLKQYMPGGKLDPNRNIASQIAKEVTPQGGRSNWEKVRLRYRDNYRSLMGQ